MFHTSLFLRQFLAFYPKCLGASPKRYSDRIVSVLPVNNNSVLITLHCLWWVLLAIVLCIYSPLLTENVDFFSGTESEGGSEAAVCVQCRPSWLHRHWWRLTLSWIRQWKPGGVCLYVRYFIKYKKGSLFESSWLVSQMHIVVGCHFLLKSLKIQCRFLYTDYCCLLLQVGVHIADVSHFIRPGNALDQEAASRGTTVYLCGKVNMYRVWMHFVIPL